MTDEGFSKGQSDNLPIVDFLMAASFFKSCESFSLGEVRGVKAKKSGRESYGDAAVGWVQVKRIDNVCTKKAKITPEHNVKKKQYTVSCNIDEEAEKVLDVQCHDCAASLGGCEHGVAFLMWLHRRSEEASPTEVSCFWPKNKLSKVGTSIKFITLADFGAQELLSSDEEIRQFFQDILNIGIDKHSPSQLLQHFKMDGVARNLGPYPSPDADGEDFTVEIKCPQSSKTISNYLTKDNKITSKYNAQVQLQMFMLKKKKCLFCEADPNFEKNFKFTCTWIKYDDDCLDSF